MFCTNLQQALKYYYIWSKALNPYLAHLTNYRKWTKAIYDNIDQICVCMCVYDMCTILGCLYKLKFCMIYSTCIFVQIGIMHMINTLTLDGLMFI